MYNICGGYYAFLKRFNLKYCSLSWKLKYQIIFPTTIIDCDILFYLIETRLQKADLQQFHLEKHKFGLICFFGFV